MMLLVNIVAAFYLWTLRKYAAKRDVSPSWVEEVGAERRPGVVRPRRVVLDMIGMHLLELFVPVIVVAAVLLLVPELLPAGFWLGNALTVLGFMLGCLPLAMVVALVVWGLLPERRLGALVDHPEWLWSPSIATYALTTVFGVVVAAGQGAIG
jgi:hypothetical protein